VTIFFSLGCFQSSFAAQEGQKEKEKRPQRAIDFYPEYTGVVVAEGEEVKMDLVFDNEGQSDEDVFLKLMETPMGWKTEIKTYSFAVTGVHVPDGEKKILTFLAQPEKGVGPGTYFFRIKGNTEDGKFQFKREITVRVNPKKEEKKTKAILITTSYPVLRGPSDVKFEFSVEVENKMDKEAVFNLAARGPSDWEVNFKPAYEQKYISSLRLKEKQNKSVAIEVKPSRDAEAGEYPLSFVVSSGEKKAEAKLKVVLTGTYKLDAVTPTGVLSLNAQRGKEANMSFYVKNTGSAANHDISFISFKPENWKVKFEPGKIDTLKAGDLKQVEAKIAPAEESLVGDYSVGLNVKGEKASDDMELRVTVKAPTTWGWVGIGIIVLVIVGLCGLFIYLGRR
jgi:uncharacterized membrane protein